MRSLVPWSFLLLSLISCKEPATSVSNTIPPPDPVALFLKLEAEFIRQGYYALPGPPGDDSTIVYYIRTKLINTGNDTIRYISMSCSYEDMYIADPADDFGIHSWMECFKNAPVTRFLPPADTAVKEVLVRPLKGNADALPFRIGFQFVNERPQTGFGKVINAYEKKDSLAHIIWSGEIK